MLVSPVRSTPQPVQLFHLTFIRPCAAYRLPCMLRWEIQNRKQFCSTWISTFFDAKRNNFMAMQVVKEMNSCRRRQSSFFFIVLLRSCILCTALHCSAHTIAMDACALMFVHALLSHSLVCVSFSHSSSSPYSLNCQLRLDAINMCAALPIEATTTRRPRQTWRWRCSARISIRAAAQPVI